MKVIKVTLGNCEAILADVQPMNPDRNLGTMFAQEIVRHVGPYCYEARRTISHAISSRTLSFATLLESYIQQGTYYYAHFMPGEWEPTTTNEWWSFLVEDNFRRDYDFTLPDDDTQWFTAIPKDRNPNRITTDSKKWRFRRG